MADVVLDHVWKTYPGGVVAVRDVSFSVAHGEFLVIVGPSGCGKSTTLRMVAGLEEISQGTISIGGRVVNDVAPKDRDIAMVFQNYALYPHMTVWDNMAFGLKMRKMAKPEIERRVREAAEILELTELLGRKPKALSGGQRQRVAVGRAIVRHPKVFLFDEPLSNLDAKLRVQMRSEISRLHRQLGATMIYVTHDQIEAMTMGTRITILKDGSVQQIDDPLSLYRRPANRFVAEFIGSPAMNVFEGGFRPDGRGYLFEEGSFSLPLPEVTGGDAFPDRVVLGVRPENLRRVEGASSERGTVEMEVELVEPLGSEIFVHGRIGSHRAVARLAPDSTVELGARVRLAPDPAHLHFFDAHTGISLRPSSPGVDA
ncbi:MAG: sn-glycerol-3-phosphate ABC transporter ATP-binding protein UgpC [bacterium]